MFVSHDVFGERWNYYIDFIANVNELEFKNTHTHRHRYSETKTNDASDCPVDASHRDRETRADIVYISNTLKTYMPSIGSCNKRKKMESVVNFIQKRGSMPNTLIVSHWLYRVVGIIVNLKCHRRHHYKRKSLF